MSERRDFLKQATLSGAGLMAAAAALPAQAQDAHTPVSYTHLTLPTIYSV